MIPKHLILLALTLTSCGTLTTPHTASPSRLHALEDCPSCGRAVLRFWVWDKGIFTPWTQSTTTTQEYLLQPTGQTTSDPNLSLPLACRDQTLPITSSKNGLTLTESVRYTVPVTLPELEGLSSANLKCQTTFGLTWVAVARPNTKLFTSPLP